MQSSNVGKNRSLGAARTGELNRSVDVRPAPELTVPAARSLLARSAGDLAKRHGVNYICAMANPPLQDFVGRHERLFVLTGAGCSTNSGIPDYRDSHGNWKRTQPVNFQAFMSRRAYAPALLGAQPDRLAAVRPGAARTMRIMRSPGSRRAGAARCC